MQACNGGKIRGLPFHSRRLLEWRPSRASPGYIRRRTADHGVLIVFPLLPLLRPVWGQPCPEEEEELHLTLSFRTCPAGHVQGYFGSQQSSARKRGETQPEGLLSFLSTGLCLLHTSKHGVKTAAAMKSKHLQVWEFPRRATKLPSVCPRSSAFTQPAAKSASTSCNKEFNLISDHKNSNSS